MCIESGEIDRDYRYRGPFIVAVDFDGVIHSYEKGWHDGTIYGEPKLYCQETLKRWHEQGFDILIYSVRAVDRTQFGETTKGQLEEMKEWLARYDIPYTSIWTGVGKPFAHLYVDDNAVRFVAWSQVAHSVGTLFNAWEEKANTG